MLADGGGASPPRRGHYPHNRDPRTSPVRAPNYSCSGAESPKRPVDSSVLTDAESRQSIDAANIPVAQSLAARPTMNYHSN